MVTFRDWVGQRIQSAKGTAQAKVIWQSTMFVLFPKTILTLDSSSRSTNRRRNDKTKQTMIPSSFIAVFWWFLHLTLKPMCFRPKPKAKRPPTGPSRGQIPLLQRVHLARHPLERPLAAGEDETRYPGEQPWKPSKRLQQKGNCPKKRLLTISFDPLPCVTAHRL